MTYAPMGGNVRQKTFLITLIALGVYGCIGTSSSVAVPPAQPGNLSTSPTSPANSTTPLVKGTVSPDAVSVELFLGPAGACSGGTPAQASGTVAEFTGPGISISVPTDRRSVICVVAVNAGAERSENLGISYDHVSYPPPAGELGVSINNGDRFTNDPKVTVSARWPSFAITALLSNDGGFGQPGTFTVSPTVSWTLDSSGPERLPKTLYARFRFPGGASTYPCGAGCFASSTETFQDDIILDETKPTIEEASLGGSGGASASIAAASAGRKLTVRAKDKTSGVSFMQVTKSKKRPGKLLKFRGKVSVPGGGRVYVRVKDGAGNFSKWREAT